MSASRLNAYAVRRPLLLLVDDYGDVREMYAQYLAIAGFDVEEARTGLEALQKAIEVKPDLILMDLRLPGMDGWEATRRIKQDERTRQIPVIALTAQPAEEAAQGAREAGCDGFIPKPWLPQDLAEEVRRWLSRADPVAARAVAAEQQSSAPPKPRAAGRRRA